MEALLIRHGAATNSDPDGKVGSDGPLLKEGIAQVRAVAVYLGNIVTAREIHSSPYRRTLETSEILAEELDLEVIIEDRLKEIDKGVWTGEPVQEVVKLEAEVPEEEVPCARPPGGENWVDVGSRVGLLLEELRAQNDQQRLLVSHNHPIRMGIGWLLGKPLTSWEDMDLDKASITRIVHNHQGWALDPRLVNFTPYAR